KLKPFDVVVQRGTNHAWINTGREPALIAAVLVDAARLRWRSRVVGKSAYRLGLLYNNEGDTSAYGLRSVAGRRAVYENSGSAEVPVAVFALNPPESELLGAFPRRSDAF